MYKKELIKTLALHFGKKVNPYDRIKELSKAGALIAAEIDRLIALNDKK